MEGTHREPHGKAGGANSGKPEEYQLYGLYRYVRPKGYGFFIKNKVSNLSEYWTSMEGSTPHFPCNKQTDTKNE